MKSMEEYTKIVFVGAGVLAERLYAQINNCEQKLVGVVDLYDNNQRTVKTFKGFKVDSLLLWKEEIEKGDIAVVMAIGCFELYRIINDALKKYPFIEDCLFVVNPYSSLRFFCVDEELSSDERISFTDSRYNKIKKIFVDSTSKKHFELLTTAKYYENINDTYELVLYKEIKDMFFAKEDYWEQYIFAKNSNNWATVFDCGAYIGDSVSSICNNIPQNNIVYYAFEPLHENAEKMLKNDFPMCNEFKVYECGVGICDEVITFQMSDGEKKDGGRFVDKKNQTNLDCELQIRSLDHMKLEIRGQLYIKMDIEGSELGALKGAEQTIKNNRPCLAICLYHRKNDLLEIPEYLNRLLSNYSFYLRGGYHTVLWAIPKELEEEV